MTFTLVHAAPTHCVTSTTLADLVRVTWAETLLHPYHGDTAAAMITSYLRKSAFSLYIKDATQHTPVLYALRGACFQLPHIHTYIEAREQGPGSYIRK